MGTPGIKLRLLDLVASAFALKAILWALQPAMFEIKHSNLVKSKMLVWHFHIEEWW